MFEFFKLMLRGAANWTEIPEELALIQALQSTMESCLVTTTTEQTPRGSTTTSTVFTAANARTRPAAPVAPRHDDGDVKMDDAIPFLSGKP
jgi:hypothetical protein